MTAGHASRTVDDEIDEFVAGLSAIPLDGARGVGKTATALQRAMTTYRLQDATQCVLVAADPARILMGGPPVLIDEWQQVPDVWNIVRRAVDDGAPPGAFLLTGSATFRGPGIHSVAGRIVSLRMRPTALSERGIEVPTVSLSALLAGGRPQLVGSTAVRLDEYAREIVGSGFPGLRLLADRACRNQLDGYLRRIAERDVEADAGLRVRDPAALLRLMRAYAAATATVASFETSRDAATGNEQNKLPRSTTIPFRDALECVWIVDFLPTWIPSPNRLARLASSSKHHLADPALAARLLGASEDSLLSGRDDRPVGLRDGVLLGALFESLVVLSVRVAAQRAEATVGHLRTGDGAHEVDLIVERRDGRILQSR